MTCVIIGDGVPRRALLGLPLLGVPLLGLAGCANDWDRVVGSPDPADPPLPPDVVPPVEDEQQSPQPSPTGPAGWAEQYDAATVGLVRGLTPSEALDVLAGPGAPRFGSFDEVMTWVEADPDYLRSYATAGTVGGWTFVWEENGYRGSLRGVARRLSARGTYASMFWNVETDMQFTYARRGTVLRTFDPFDLDSAQGAPLPQERGLDLGYERAPMNELVLLSRLTGTPVADPSWRERPGVIIVGVS